MGITLSVVIITYNSEAKIRDCLESVKWADEIVVVDSYSTDRTVEICREYTDKIFLNDGFTPAKPDGAGRQKNFAIAQATGDWVLSLDSDERITPPLAAEIQQVLASQPEFAGYAFPREEQYFGFRVKYAVGYPHWQTRLFRRGRGAFVERGVHEYLAVEGKVGHLTNIMTHFANEDMAGYIAKINRYTSLDAAEMYAQRQPVNGWALCVSPLKEFIWRFIRLRGYRDGLPGLVVSLFLAVYRFFCWAKLWELYQREVRG